MCVSRQVCGLVLGAFVLGPEGSNGRPPFLSTWHRATATGPLAKDALRDPCVQRGTQISTAMLLLRSATDGCLPPPKHTRALGCFAANRSSRTPPSVARSAESGASYTVEVCEAFPIQFWSKTGMLHSRRLPAVLVDVACESSPFGSLWQSTS